MIFLIITLMLLPFALPQVGIPLIFSILFMYFIFTVDLTFVIGFVKVVVIIAIGLPILLKIATVIVDWLVEWEKRKLNE